MAVEKACPLHVTQMKVWTGLGGSNSGVIGNRAHSYGFHRGAAFIPATDYSRWRDPQGSDGPYPDWGWCCAGDYSHGGKAVLRARHAVLFTRLLDNDPALAHICEFIGQPYADRPVLYWARWNGIRTVQKYVGSGHDKWSHVSAYRSLAGKDAPLWTPASGAVTESGKVTTKPTTLKPPAWPKGQASFKASSSPKYSALVRQWQARMKQRGWTVKADGYYGPSSAALARAFQKDKRITQDGILGPVTFTLAWTSPIT